MAKKRTPKCKQAYKWQIKRFTRKAKSKNTLTRKHAKSMLKLIKPFKKDFMKKHCDFYKVYNNYTEKEYNEQLDKVEILERLKAMQSA